MANPSTYHPEELCTCGHKQEFHLLSLIDGEFYAQGCMYNLTHADPSGFVLYCSCEEYHKKETS
jgi:hypothetical protein